MTRLPSLLFRLRRSRSNSQRVRLFKLFAGPVIRAMLRLDPDPVVEVDLGRRKLALNWSHKLPDILRDFPNYETEIGRLAHFLHSKRGRLTMIDIGANVGDTIALLPELAEAKYLCVEGSAKYFELLKRNYASDPRVCAVQAMVTDQNAEYSGLQLVESGGTAHLEVVRSSTGANAPAMTVDEIVATCPAFAAADFLKIDTDGYDFRVLAGAAALLKNFRPALHFELCFSLWEKVGGTAVHGALQWLSAAGYRTGILYDNQGYMIGTDELSDQIKIHMLQDYASRKPTFYLNVIAFHESTGFTEEFFALEREHRF